MIVHPKYIFSASKLYYSIKVTVYMVAVILC